METIAKRGTVNGVDIDRLFGTIEAVSQQPALAAFAFRARNRWVRGGHNQSMVQGFSAGGNEDHSRSAPFVLDNDEPDVLLGSDRGANPVEQVLHGLAGCLTTSLVYHAAAQGIAIDAVESTLEGDLDLRGFLGMSEDVRNGYEQIRVSFRVSADLTDGQLQELVTLAQQRSPVFDIISNRVPVSVHVQRG